MATLGELRDIIIADIEDDDFEEEEIERHINNCVSHIANKILLPSLENTGQVTTVVDTPYIPLPKNYGRGLFACVRADGQLVDVLPSTTSIRRRYGLFDSAPNGSVLCCALQGRKLAIINVPKIPTDLSISYYAKPPRLEEDDTLDDILSDQALQEDLVKHYVLSVLWKRIEDGIDGGFVNTNYHQSMFERSLEELESSLIGEGINHPPPPRQSGNSL